MSDREAKDLTCCGGYIVGYVPSTS